jgi:hypothetical protein
VKQPAEAVMAGQKLYHFFTFSLPISNFVHIGAFSVSHRGAEEGH